MQDATQASWRRRLGLAGWLAPIAVGLFVFGFGQELWSRYLPEYLRFLGASALTVGAFGALEDLLEAAYAYPGGWLADRFGSRRALLLFAGALWTIHPKLTFSVAALLGLCGTVWAAIALPARAVPEAAR